MASANISCEYFETDVFSIRFSCCKKSLGIYEPGLAKELIGYCPFCGSMVLEITEDEEG